MISCIFENKSKANLRHVVVHALVEKDGCILLEKRAETLSEGGKWALPGGFLDHGETVAQGALRELLEETGWIGNIISLFRINSNPNRPREDHRQNVAVEFIISPVKKIQEGDHESSKVEWIPIENLIAFDQFAFDHGETIRLYLEYRKKAFQLPLVV